jgi:hypothetical protein
VRGEGGAAKGNLIATTLGLKNGMNDCILACEAAPATARLMANEALLLQRPEPPEKCLRKRRTDLTL